MAVIQRCCVSVRLHRVFQTARNIATTQVKSAAPAHSSSLASHQPLCRLSSPLLALTATTTTIPPLLTQPLSRQHVARLCTETVPSIRKQSKTITITFIDRDGDEVTVQGKLGDTLLDVAHEHDIDLEGACEGTLSCSTCHLVVEPEWYDKIPDPLTEEEQDMLDLAYGLTDTSRLGCQIVVTKALDGIKLTVPSGTMDVRNI